MITPSYSGILRSIIIDNYDSFTFNLYQLIGQVNGDAPLVVRNDEMSWDELAALSFDNIVISPGPGTASRLADFGVCGEVLLRAEVPVLGVCLGHQGIGLAYGGKVCHAPEPMHGRASRISHDGAGLFAGIPQGFAAIRYHSLMVEPELPAVLRQTAWTDDGILMGLEHRDLPRYGVQFHPESICTEYGDLLLRNFRDMTPRSKQAGYTSRKREGNPPARQGGEIHTRRMPFDTSKAGLVFQRLYREDKQAFWLDSSHLEAGLSRFSFMGGSGGPHSRFVTGDVYESLRRELARRYRSSDELPFDFNCGFVGYFGYEMNDGAFLFADRMIAFDHEKSEAWLVCYGSAEESESWIEETARILREDIAEEGPVPPQEAELTLRLDRDQQTYLADIARCKELIRDGESYEICLTNQLRATPPPDPLGLYLKLREANPAPWSAYLRFGDLAVLCNSPERFLRIDGDRMIESRPMKGTRPRGATADEDAALRLDLRENEKDRSENLMIVDLVRNDLGRVCEIGSVVVPKLMAVESYETVHQLVSIITGRLRTDVDMIDCIRAAFPAGSMTGAPKLRTMHLLEQMEKTPRGIYSGSLGFLSLNGRADLNVVIRTLVWSPKEATLGIGGAIVALSDPMAEFDETLVKARSTVQTLIANVLVEHPGEPAQVEASVTDNFPAPN